jgi:phosphinothricin acetyltransferase
MALQIVPATEHHLGGVTEIYNDVIARTTAVYSSEPVTVENRSQWLRDRILQGYPVWIAVDDDRVLGFGALSDFRGAFPGYRYTVEHTVHVRDGERGQGVGGRLLAQLIRSAEELGKHVMIGAVDAENVASIRFHNRYGFREVARLRQVGHKFGKWLDLVFLQKMLDDRPVPPV